MEMHFTRHFTSLATSRPKPCSPRQSKSFHLPLKGLSTSPRRTPLKTACCSPQPGSNRPGRAWRSPTPPAAGTPPQREFLATEPGPGSALHREKRCGLAGLPRSQQMPARCGRVGPDPASPGPAPLTANRARPPPLQATEHPRGPPYRATAQRWGGWRQITPAPAPCPPPLTILE